LLFRRGLLLGRHGGKDRSAFSSLTACNPSDWDKQREKGRKGGTASTRKRERRGRRRKRGTRRRRFCHTHHQRRKSSLSLHKSCVLFFCLRQSAVARRKNSWDSQFPVVALLQEELLHC
jgi:hypothetical protein